MTSKVFKTNVVAAFRLGKKFERAGRTIADEDFEKIDAVRKAYEKFKSALYNLAMYPHGTIQEAKQNELMLREMVEEANCNISVIDYFDSESARKIYHTPAYVSFNGIDITDIVNTLQK